MKEKLYRVQRPGMFSLQTLPRHWYKVDGGIQFVVITNSVMCLLFYAGQVQLQ